MEESLAGQNVSPGQRDVGTRKLMDPRDFLCGAALALQRLGSAFDTPRPGRAVSSTGLGLAIRDFACTLGRNGRGSERLAWRLRRKMNRPGPGIV